MAYQAVCQLYVLIRDLEIDGFHLDIFRMKGSSHNVKRASLQVHYNKHQTYF